MKKSELLDLLKDIDDDADIDEVISESYLNLDNFKNKIENDKEFKSFMDSEKDKHTTKAIATALDNFKKKDMQKLIDAEILKRTGENETPEQKEIRELKEQFANLQKEKELTEMKNKYKDVLTEKHIPTNLIDFLLGDDDDLTSANIEIFENAMKEYIDTKVEDRIKDSSYTPPKNDNKNVGGISYEDVLNNPDLYSKWKNQQQG